MNEGSFAAGGRFHFLLTSQTLPLLAGNSLLVIQKAKLLNMNSNMFSLDLSLSSPSGRDIGSAKEPR